MIVRFLLPNRAKLLWKHRKVVDVVVLELVGNVESIRLW